MKNTLLSGNILALLIFRKAIWTLQVDVTLKLKM